MIGSIMELYNKPIYGVDPKVNSKFYTYFYNEVYKDRMYDSPECQVSEGDIVLDLGANIGFFTIYALLEKKASKVYAFEPHAETREALMKNIESLNLQDKVVIVPYGVWCSSATMSFFSSDNPGGHHLEDNGDDGIVRRAFHRETTSHPDSVVEVISIDDFVDKYKVNSINFIKMDIEGAEREAVKGATKTLRYLKPKMCISAYHKLHDQEVIPQLVLDAVSSYTTEIFEQGSFQRVCRCY